MTALCRAFVTALPDGLHADPSPVLEAALTAVVERARGPWPAFAVGAQDYVAHLSARLTEVPTDPAAWDAIRAADLYLAFACAQGDRLALAAFERNYATPVRQKAERIVRGSVHADDVRQHVWQKLFVGVQGGRPKINDYTGRGPLHGWLGVIVARTAIDLGRSAGAGARSLGQGIAELERDPELEYLKSHYREAFEAALSAAIAGLSAKQRNMMAYNLIDQLDTNEIGRIYGVHRTSAGRWLAQARDALLTQTRRELMRRLKVQSDDVDSIMRLIGSRLHVTFRHLLRPSE